MEQKGFMFHTCVENDSARKTRTAFRSKFQDVIILRRGARSEFY
jgi:hypothetical protein